MLGVILALLIVPLAAGLACAVWPKASPVVTGTSGVASFGLVLALVPAAAHHDLGYLTYLRVDALSVIFLLATGFLYAAVGIYSIGYIQHHGHGDRYARRFYTGFNLFAWAMLAAPLMSSLALLWIAVEVTTIISALLVAIEAVPTKEGDGAAEAAWKYVLIASAGLGLALLATVFAYFAGAQVLGEHYNLAVAPLIQHAAHLAPTPVRLAFLLALLGYGTKAGLVPVHTWLPDAHSEAPTPVSALLSGSMLAVSLYAILRYYQVAAAALGSGFPRDALLAFGVASLLLAALYVFGQRDIKRLLAYSSIEHMGIVTIGVSFGAPVALAGVMLHVLAHAAAKGNAFMGAGVFTVKYGTKQIATMRGALDVLPWSGPLFLLAIFALSALPPSGIFRSEFQIVAGGLGSGNYAAAAVLVVLVTVAFFGLTTASTRILFTTAPRSLSAAAAIDRGEPSAWMAVPVVAGVVVLFTLGLHPPGELTGLIARAVAELGDGAMTMTQPDVLALWREIEARIAAGGRFAGLFATQAAARQPVTLSAHLATPDDVDTLEVTLPAGAAGYPALTPRVGAAFWYERVIHDQFGLVPEGHPRLAPLIRPGHPLPRHVEGYGLFTIPHGPVRSGVLESIEYLVETPGEAIPHLNMRVFYKHRGVEPRFTGLTLPDGILLAERAEGIASVAHALAFCHAAERMAGCVPPPAAALVRVLHAELERIANHLDVAVRLADAAGLAVATARLALHKERVMRLVSQMCGSRFGRGVVVPGGVAALPRLAPAELGAEVERLARQVKADAAALMATSSFLDRLRGTGPLTPGRARTHGALGPIGKAAGFADDNRLARPYDGYPDLALAPARSHAAGDAMARLRVRWEEVDQSFGLLRLAADELAERTGDQLRARCEPAGGRAVGWAEAPQGEVLYDLSLAGGRIARCHPRSASFHNLVLMHEVFAGDILTDFPFIEASFGLSVAGVAL